MLSSPHGANCPERGRVLGGEGRTMVEMTVTVVVVIVVVVDVVVAVVVAVA